MNCPLGNGTKGETPCVSHTLRIPTFFRQWHLASSSSLVTSKIAGFRAMIARRSTSPSKICFDGQAFLYPGLRVRFLFFLQDLLLPMRVKRQCIKILALPFFAGRKNYRRCPEIPAPAHSPPVCKGKLFSEPGFSPTLRLPIFVSPESGQEWSSHPRHPPERGRFHLLCKGVLSLP